jgi:hypothetical protein
MSADAGGRGRAPRQRHEVRRHPERANYDRGAAYAVLDAACVGHVAFVLDGQPFVIPMLYARDGDRLLLHGGMSSRLLKALATGTECCVAVTHVDGLVLARSQFHHSVNYRSVVAFGRARVIEDRTDKAAALVRLVEAIVPGRTSDARAADRQELNATVVLGLPIADLSLKSRSGDPSDAVDDLAFPVWSGVIPLALRAAPPVAAADMDPAIPLPAYLDTSRAAVGPDAGSAG